MNTLKLTLMLTISLFAMNSASAQSFLVKPKKVKTETKKSDKDLTVEELNKILNASTTEETKSKKTEKSEASEKYSYLTEQLINVANEYKGVRYSWGGMSRNGMDCSGFVSWTIRNACKPSYGSRLANFGSSGMDHGDHIKLEEAKPGDLMLKTGHVRLVIKNNGDGSIIVAEETFGSNGLVFKKYDSLKEYKIIDMSKWYSNNCNNSR